jgi:hypothetical protein
MMCVQSRIQLRKAPPDHSRIRPPPAKLIDQAVVIPDREERNKIAKYIIQVMGSLNPHLRDVPDFQHKLWTRFLSCLISS